MESGIYRDYKGGYYQVLGVAEHTETGERVVVYVSLTGISEEGPRMRVRPVGGPDGFFTMVRLGDELVARFSYCGEELSAG